MDKHLQQYIPENQVLVKAGSFALEGIFLVPQGAKGVVLFANGSGNHRNNPRDRFIAKMLYNAKLATLLIDLLTPQEEESDRQTKRLGCDIDRLLARLIGVTNWLRNNPTTQNLKIGYLGDRIGSPAALVAATFFEDIVQAIACYSGHLDLTGSALFHVRVPTLLIVGGNDTPILAINRRIVNYLRTKKQLVIIPNVTHLFEKPGSLKKVAWLTRRWFEHYLAPVDPQAPNVQSAQVQKAISQS